MWIPVQDLEGRDHFVVPMVMITVGVHCGSRGPVYYPAEELRQSVTAWNGKPIVAYHPDMLYSNGFADNPSVFNRQKVGTIFNTRFADWRLKAEAWIDIERVKRLDVRIHDAILNKRMMEVSTGLMFPLNADCGTFNGAEYAMVARAIQPDHLAILPDKRGACSIADGAGLVRNDHLEEALLTPTWSF